MKKRLTILPFGQKDRRKSTSSGFDPLLVSMLVVTIGTNGLAIGAMLILLAK